MEFEKCAKMWGSCRSSHNYQIWYYCVLLGKYADINLGGAPPLVTPPDSVTGEYLSVVVTFGVTLPCHCCDLIGTSAVRYLESSKGGRGLFSLSWLNCVEVVGGATDENQ